MKDIHTQVLFVQEAVHRILGQIDLDILSPHFGCAHLAYWRDKTSPLADMRRQEAMLALSLLYLNDYPSSSWKGDDRLKFAVEALLTFWSKSQYADGSMDEWYKGERGFAAVAFSTHTVARTLAIMENTISKDIYALVKKKIKKTAYWLVNHDDLFKTNHEAVAVCALAWAGSVLQDNSIKDHAYKKLNSIIRVQSEEGWFPEVGYMDIGYTFLTLEFILMAMNLWGDYRYIEPFRRAFDFVCEWIHPDLTVGEEYSICHNTYISRIAIILMSSFSNRAAYLRKRLEEETVGPKGYAPTLVDDLRLLRYSYQPLLAYEYALKVTLTTSLKPEAMPLLNTDAQIKIYEEASLVRFSCRGGSGIFAPAAGGLIRFFGSVIGTSLSDYGYAVGLDGGYATNLTYNRNVRIQKNEKGLLITVFLSQVKKFIPPFWMRVVLHLFCVTSIGSRVTRKAIDIIRQKKGTAINQSSVNLNSRKSAWVLHRQVLIQKDRVEVTDKLVFKNPVRSKDLFFLESGNGALVKRYPITCRLSGISDRVKCLEITKCYYPNGNWFLREISANKIDRG